MFFVLNKQKIYTYIVSAVMVLFLFCAASTLNVNNDNNTVQTSATYSKLLPIYNVQTDEKKVAFTMNCAWKADDIDSILETLKNNNVKITAIQDTANKLIDASSLTLNNFEIIN